MIALLIAAALCAAPTEADAALADAGRKLAVRSITTGQPDAGLLAMAQEQAQYCADHCLGGHQCFDRQFRENWHRYPSLCSVVAESWPGQNMTDSAAECFNSWRQSAGHWRAVNGACKRWGYAMRLGRNGTWYGAGYFSQ